jgi:hypothetical protein
MSGEARFRERLDPAAERLDAGQPAPGGARAATRAVLGPLASAAAWAQGGALGGE